MDVPRFPPPPKLTSKVTDEELDVTSPRQARPVSFETPASRRRNAILLRGVLPARGAGGGGGGGERGGSGGGGRRKGRRKREGEQGRGGNCRNCSSVGYSSRCFIKNLVHPRKSRTSRRRVTEFKLKMTERRDDDDVVCATVFRPTCTSRSPKLQDRVMKNGDINNEDRQELTTTTTTATTRSTGIQTTPTVPYRLRMLPSLEDVVLRPEEPLENPKKSSRIWKHLRFIGRLSLCQFGLAWLLSIWAVAGAAAFYGTEGPREREQVAELSAKQKELAINLATELRQVKAEEPIWGSTVQRYVIKHEKLLLSAVSSGYGESGGGGGQVWTFPGCFLFAVSLLTTLGFGAPVPRTTAGRTVAVLFAAIGIPAHFLLILNMGIFLAVRLQNFAKRKKMIELKNANGKTTTTTTTSSSSNIASENSSVPKWVKIVPFACIGGYYVLGIICFGVARLRPTAASLLFPLDFTAAGGLATTSGSVRIAYAIYLEGAVTIAALAVAILQVSATQSLTNIGLRYGLLTNT